MNTIAKLLTLALTLGFGATSLVSSAGADTLQDILETEANANKYAQESQDQVDSINNQTRQVVAEYRQLLRQIESLEIYNAQIQRLIDGQTKEIDTLNADISRVTQINREITPLMLEMLEGLKAFVSADIPFRAEERTERLARLDDMMDRADVTTAEKFRRVLEAYQIENEYGRTIEAYTGTLDKDGQTLQVDFLQVGRVAFIYVTGDNSEAGVWDKDSGQWVELDEGQISGIRRGISIALQQTTPDLMTLPIPAPEKAQ